MPDSMYDHLFRSPRDSRIFSEDAHLAAMLHFEAALARVEAQLGIIPFAAAERIASCCGIEIIDEAALAEESTASGNLAIPLVKQLTSAVRARSVQAAGYVHWGATSQDIIDTAMMMQLHEHLSLIGETVDSICEVLASLIETHRHTMMTGRTWLQHAVPTSFGLIAAGWLDGFLRHRERLVEMQPRVLVLQFGGAAGTLASLDQDGLQVAAALAQELNLTLPAVPWHTQRDRTAEVAVFHGLLAGSAGKIARDLSLGMQTEIGEFAEPSGEGRGGSSTMPHKRNPVSCAAILSASIRIPGLVSTMLSAMVQEQQRGLGGWHAEWETLPEICTLSFGALEKLAALLAGLEVNPEAMLRNIAATNGLIAAEAVSLMLARYIGRDKAHKLVEGASRRAVAAGISLQDALDQTPEITVHLNGHDLDVAMELGNYLGSSERMIDNVLADFHRVFPSGIMKDDRQDTGSGLDTSSFDVL